MYTVQIQDSDIVFGPDARGRSQGDWPVFTFTAEQAEALASALRRAAAAVRWTRAAAFAVGEIAAGTPLYHLAPAGRDDALTAPALCGHTPQTRLDHRRAWTSIRPLNAVDPDDPRLCRACLAQWEAEHT